LREIAALRGEFGDLSEKATIVADEIEAGEDDGDEDGSEEEIELALDAVVDRGDASCGALFGFVCFGRGGGRRWSSERLGAAAECLGFAGQRRIRARLREGEHAIYGVPELREGLIQIAALIAGGCGYGKGRLLLKGVDEVGADAFELRDPGDDGVRLGGILHVAHSEAEGVEIVLDAEKLERVTAIAVDEFAWNCAVRRIGR